MQNYNAKLKTKKIVLNFELWFLVFLPVRCTQTGKKNIMIFTIL